MSTPEENKSTAANFLLTPETILQSRYRIVSHLGKGGRESSKEISQADLRAQKAARRS